MLLLGCLLWSSLSFGQGASDALSPRPSSHLVFEPQQVLDTAQHYLRDLRLVALYQPIEESQRGRARYAVQVLLGLDGQATARLALHPRGLKPLPLGLEDQLPPLPPRLRPQRVAEMVETDVLGHLLLANMVLTEAGGYKLLLVHSGRMVGELLLDHELDPRPGEAWVETFTQSAWRYPEDFQFHFR